MQTIILYPWQRSYKAAFTYILQAGGFSQCHACKHSIKPEAFAALVFYELCQRAFLAKGHAHVLVN